MAMIFMQQDNLIWKFCNRLFKESFEAFPLDNSHGIREDNALRLTIENFSFNVDKLKSFLVRGFEERVAIKPFPHLGFIFETVTKTHKHIRRKTGPAKFVGQFGIFASRGVFSPERKLLEDIPDEIGGIPAPSINPLPVFLMLNPNHGAR